MGGALRRVTKRGDEGFTLVEMLVSLVVVSIVFTALAYATTTALKASMLSRTNQQAIDLGDQRLEQIRDLPYASVAMDSSDLTGDSNISTCSGKPCVTLGDGTTEKIYTATGGLKPHVTTQVGSSTNNITFTLKTYVTAPTDAIGASYRRVSVQVTWNNGAQQLTRWVSSIVSYTQRGLPLPVFKLYSVNAATQTVAANDGWAAFEFDLTNQGAADKWDLSMSGTRSWGFYLDDGDGVFDPTKDTLLTDTSGNSVVDTGLLAPTQSIHFWAASQVATGTTPATLTQTLTAKSVAQPLAATGTSTVTTTLTIIAPGATATPTVTPTSSSGSPSSSSPSGPVDCPAASVPAASASNGGYTLVQYMLHNRSGANPAWPPVSGTIPGTSTVTQGIPLTMAADAAEVPTGQLPAYSTNIDGTVGGRIVQSGGDATTTDTTKVVDWRSGATSKSYKGTAVLQIWAGAVPGYTLTSMTVYAELYYYKATTTGSGKNAVTTYAESPLQTVAMVVNPWSCTGFQQLTASYAGLNLTLKSGEYMGLRLWNSSGTRIRLAYDVVSPYAATLVLPEK